MGLHNQTYPKKWALKLPKIWSNSCLGTYPNKWVSSNHTWGKRWFLTTKHAKDRLSKELGLTVSIRPSVNDIGHLGDSRSLSIKQSESIDGSPQNHLPHRIHVCYIWYCNIYYQYTPNVSIYIYHTWILWVLYIIYE